MKKIVTVFLCLILLFSCAVPVLAVEETEEKTYTGVMEVLDVNLKSPRGIKIDGVMEQDEWGKPVYTTTPRQVIKNRNYNWDYYEYSKIPENQRVEIYVSNDGDYIYVACKLIGADYDAGSKTADRTEVQKHAHFGFTIGYYVDGTVIPIKTYKNDDYEHYVHYVMANVDGEKWHTSYSLGMTVVKLTDDQYNFAYDMATRTYTYEVKVPIKNTELNLTDRTDAVMSFDIGDAIKGETSGNRYLISKGASVAWRNLGAYNFPHAKSWPILVKLLDRYEIDRIDFVPTPEEEIIAADSQQGFIDYEQVTRAEEKEPIFSSTEILCMAAAALVVTATVVFLIIRKKRS